ncbi:hypothetical protein AX16_008742 [Volvariella volvacea WC 439]|nr:hypothetical protein AX16_008742 [Volvariella volvacea WC 439]
MSSTMNAAARKRVLSNADDSTVAEHRKRPRISLSSTSSQSQIFVGSPIVATWLDRLPKPRQSLAREDIYERSFSAPRTPLSRCSSFSSLSRAASPGSSIATLDHTEGSAFISRSGMELMRTLSTASLASSPPSVYVPSYADTSARYYLRGTKTTIDFSTPADGSIIGSNVLSCSAESLLLFSRGNRVHYKNLISNEEVGQLCKLQQENHGDLRIIECGGMDQPEVVALGTTKGFVQIWDIKAKKMTASWSTKGVAVMKWNGPILTLGGLKGTIRHYDTRINPTSKMKEQVKKVTRHQVVISSLGWNVEGNLLASGDESGTVYCWDSRQQVPLDVGEFVQRRKKMQHEAAVRALAWCPWQPKLLASADMSGTVRMWNINASPSHSNATSPGKLELDSAVTGIHFSPHCKEFLTTHGAQTSSASGSPVIPPGAVRTANSISVYSYPSLRHVNTLSVAEHPIEGSVMNPNGTRVIVSVPKDNKLHVCDVWLKKKEVKRQPSFMSSSTIR